MKRSARKAPDAETAPAPYVVCVFDEDTQAANDFEFKDLAKAVTFAREEDVYPSKTLVLERRFVRGKWQEFCVDLEPRDET